MCKVIFQYEKCNHVLFVIPQICNINFGVHEIHAEILKESIISTSIYVKMYISINEGHHKFGFQRNPSLNWLTVKLQRYCFVEKGNIWYPFLLLHFNYMHHLFLSRSVSSWFKGLLKPISQSSLDVMERVYIKTAVAINIHWMYYVALCVNISINYFL